MMHQPNLMRKTDYHKLCEYLQIDEIDNEIAHVLDRFNECAEKAVVWNRRSPEQT